MAAADSESSLLILTLLLAKSQTLCPRDALSFEPLHIECWRHASLICLKLDVIHLNNLQFIRHPFHSPPTHIH